MLLPSALSCDSSQPPRLQSALFMSPPTSPHHVQQQQQQQQHYQPMSTQSAIGNLINSCRNLHSLISSASPSSSPRNLPSPPLAHKSRLRRREEATAHHSSSSTAPVRYRIKKRSPKPPPRGINKRRRAVDDDLGRDDAEDEEIGLRADQEGAYVFGQDATATGNNSGDMFVFQGYQPTSPRAAPSTPKRQRIAPPEVPMGLTREDFHKISEHQPQAPIAMAGPAASAAASTTIITKEGSSSSDQQNWSVEDDSKLVEIVLEKVKNMDLSREVWDDCVRNLPGRDHGSVSSRWKSLLRTERVGLQKKGRSSRGRLHGTW